MKPFHTWFSVDDQAQLLVNILTNDFDGFVKIKDNQSRASWVPSLPHLVGIALHLLFKKPLFCN
jgi:hypothetical protein